MRRLLALVGAAWAALVVLAARRLLGALYRGGEWADVAEDP